jgi:hypothetical protein
MKGFLLTCLGVLTLAPAAMAQADSSDSGTSNAAQVDSTSAIVQLVGDPLSTYAATKPPPGKKIDFNSNTVKSYRAQLAAGVNAFKSWLKANAPQANVTGKFDIALNAVSVDLNGTSLSTILTCPQVVSAQYETVFIQTRAILIWV